MVEKSRQDSQYIRFRNQHSTIGTYQVNFERVGMMELKFVSLKTVTKLTQSRDHEIIIDECVYRRWLRWDETEEDPFGPTKTKAEASGLENWQASKRSPSWPTCYCLSEAGSYLSINDLLLISSKLYNKDKTDKLNLHESVQGSSFKYRGRLPLSRFRYFKEPFLHNNPFQELYNYQKICILMAFPRNIVQYITKDSNWYDTLY